MPSHHAQTLRERRPLSRRRKLFGLGAGGALLIALVLVLLLSNGRSPQRGCLSFDLAGAMGAEPVHQCGTTARRTCASARESRREFGSVGVLNLEAACRAGRLSVG